jgi:pimeloyl-ACP methyl ester carboxylesterase
MLYAWLEMITIVPIHGNGGGALRFARLLPHMPTDVALQPITLPGFADQAADPALRSLADYAGHVHSLLADLPRPRLLLGHGIGGSIALEFVQHYAAAIDGLILHAPVGTRLDRRLFPRLMRLPGTRPALQALISSALLRPFFYRRFFQQAVPRDYVDRFFQEYGRCRVFGQMFDLITADWYRHLQPVDLPAVLLWGEDEKVLSVDQIEDYRRLLPNSRARIVPAWDHFPMIDRPADYAAEITVLARTLAGATMPRV